MKMKRKPRLKVFCVVKLCCGVASFLLFFCCTISLQGQSVAFDRTPPEYYVGEEAIVTITDGNVYKFDSGKHAGIGMKFNEIKNNANKGICKQLSNKAGEVISVIFINEDDPEDKLPDGATAHVIPISGTWEAADYTLQNKHTTVVSLKDQKPKDCTYKITSSSGCFIRNKDIDSFEVKTNNGRGTKCILNGNLLPPERLSGPANVKLPELVIWFVHFSAPSLIIQGHKATDPQFHLTQKYSPKDAPMAGTAKISKILPIPKNRSKWGSYNTTVNTKPLVASGGVAKAQIQSTWVPKIEYLEKPLPKSCKGTVEVSCPEYEYKASASSTFRAHRGN